MRTTLMLVLAIWITAGSGSAVHIADAIAREISDRGATLARVGSWIEQHLTKKSVLGATAFAWIDTLSSATEAFLLWRGRAWGEWIVVASLAVFVPVEAVSLERHPSRLKLAILVVNAGVVAYLVCLRVLPRMRKGRG